METPVLTCASQIDIFMKITHLFALRQNYVLVPKNGGTLLCNTLLYHVQVLHLNLFIYLLCPVCCLCNGTDSLPMMLLSFLMKANKPKSVSL